MDSSAVPHRTTADTLRAVFNVIGLAHGTSTLFGFFLLENRQAAPDLQCSVCSAG